MFSSTGGVSFVLVIVRVIRASEGGANYIGDRERCSRPTMEIALPNPPPPCPPSLLLATNDPSLLPPRRRRTFSRQTAAPSTIRPPSSLLVARPRDNQPLLSPNSIVSLADSSLDRLPHPTGEKESNRALSDKNRTRGEKLLSPPFEIRSICKSGRKSRRRPRSVHTAALAFQIRRERERETWTDFPARIRGEQSTRSFSRPSSILFSPITE